MKRFGLHIVWFMLPVVLVAIVMEFGLRMLPNDYKVKHHYLDAHAEEVEVLFLGNSHMYYGVNPAFISKNSFNAAYVSQSIDFDLALLKKYEKQLKKLHYLVVPMDYFTLYNSLETTDETWRIKNYALYYNLDNLPYKYHFELINGKFEYAVKRLEYYFTGQSPITCNTLGFGTAYKANKSLELEENGKLAAKRHTEVHFKPNEKLLATLHQFVLLAKKHDVKLVLVTCPAYSSYVHHLNPNQLHEMNRVVQNILKDTNHVMYYNSLTHPAFHASDFFDGDHLNDRGAKKFSLLLNTVLEEKNKR
nr:hypothetical protein [uncultured Flavobacterium sp.]